MEPLGFAQSTPKLKFLFACDPNERKALGIHLLKLRPSFTRGMQSLFITGELKVPPTTFVLKRKLDFVSPIVELPPESWVPCAPHPPPHLFPNKTNFARAKTFCDNFRLTCHNCGNSRKFTRVPFKSNIWTNIWCAQCQCTFVAHRWHCPCKISWRSCHIHSHWAAYATILHSKRFKHCRLDRRAKHNASESSSSTFLRQVHINRAIDTFELRNHDMHNIPPCQESVLTPHKREAPEFLGHILRKCPKLQHRFPHLAAG